MIERWDRLRQFRFEWPVVGAAGLASATRWLLLLVIGGRPGLVPVRRGPSRGHARGEGGGHGAARVDPIATMDLEVLMHRTAAASLALLLLAPAAGQAQPSTEGGSEKVIALVLFPEITLLDLVGPLQVLKSLPAPYRTVVVGERKEPMATDVGLALTPERTFAEVPRPFAVIVPGGPGSVAAMGNAAVQDYLRAAAPRAEVVGSVCTGGLVLAATGLLEGRRGTTHWAYARELEKLGAHYVRERWVEDGKFITAGGVSAGIDMAIALAARLTDRATAQRIQLGIEYDPTRPGVASIGARWGRRNWLARDKAAPAAA